MKLQALLSCIDKNFVRENNFIHLERYVNDARGGFEKYSDVHKKYSPQYGYSEFDAFYKLLKRESLTILRNNPAPDLENEIIVGDFAKFVWHPSIDSHFKTSDGKFKVVPTSSTRTLLTRGLSYNFMIKTDMDKRHFRFIRRLKGSSVSHSIAMSKDIAEATLIATKNYYGFLPETLGLIYGDSDTGSGVLFRQLRPRPIVNEPRQLIPYFSLYSRDSIYPQDIPLLIELIQSNSPNDPLGFFVDRIVGMIQDTWVYFVTERGILPELHGQNILLEIDSNGIPTRLIQRDFQSLYSDYDIRNNKNLTQFEKHVIGVEDNITKEQQYSLVFDHMISKYIIERMVRVFIDFFPRYSYNEVANLIRHRFNEIPYNPLHVFPRTTYRFSKKAMRGNEVKLIDTKEKPLFR